MTNTDNKKGCIVAKSNEYDIEPTWDLKKVKSKVFHTMSECGGDEDYVAIYYPEQIPDTTKKFPHRLDVLNIVGGRKNMADVFETWIDAKHLNAKKLDITAGQTWIAFKNAKDATIDELEIETTEFSKSFVKDIAKLPPGVNIKVTGGSSRIKCSGKIWDGGKAGDLATCIKPGFELLPSD